MLVIILGTFRLHHEYETVYEYDFPISKPVTFPEPSLFMLVLGREGSSWDEMSVWSDNMKPSE